MMKVSNKFKYTKYYLKMLPKNKIIFQWMGKKLEFILNKIFHEHFALIIPIVIIHTSFHSPIFRKRNLGHFVLLISTIILRLKLFLLR